MGVEAKYYHRVRCMACKYREDHETEELADADFKEHNDVLHNGKKLAERGRFDAQNNYWRFPV